MPTGYRLYAASAADFVGTGQVGSELVIASASLTVWDAVTGGLQVTDLLDPSEAPVTEVPTDDFGNFRFYAKDTLGTLWVSTDGGATRYATQPADVGTRVKDAETRLTGAEAEIDLLSTGVGGTDVPITIGAVLPDSSIGYPHIHIIPPASSGSA